MASAGVYAPPPLPRPFKAGIAPPMNKRIPHDAMTVTSASRGTTTISIQANSS